MKSFNRYAAFSLRAILAAAVVMFGIIRPIDYGSRAEPTAFAAEQPAPGALQWRQTSGPEGADVSSLLSVGPNLFAGTSFGGVISLDNQGEKWTPINDRPALNAKYFNLSPRRDEHFRGISDRVGITGRPLAGSSARAIRERLGCTSVRGLTNLVVGPSPPSGRISLRGRSAASFDSATRERTGPQSTTGIDRRITILGSRRCRVEHLCRTDSTRAASVFRSDGQAILGRFD